MESNENNTTNEIITNMNNDTTNETINVKKNKKKKIIIIAIVLLIVATLGCIYFFKIKDNNTTTSKVGDKKDDNSLTDKDKDKDLSDDGANLLLFSTACMFTDLCWDVLWNCRTSSDLNGNSDLLSVQYPSADNEPAGIRISTWEGLQSDRGKSDRQ